MSIEPVAYKTPLQDLLRAIPKDDVVMYDVSPTESHNFPYGRLCHEAADAIDELQRQLAESKENERLLHQACADYEQEVPDLQRQLADVSANQFCEMHLKADIDELQRQNFALAAGQCCVKNGLVGDEHGNQVCELQRQLDDEIRNDDALHVTLTSQAYLSRQIIEAYRNDVLKIIEKYGMKDDIIYAEIELFSDKLLMDEIRSKT